MPQQHVVVIGAGVIGLSSALLLQEADYAVTIVARDFMQPFETTDKQAAINYTSPWGGAHNRWVPPKADGTDTREHALSLATFARMRALHGTHAPAAGITFLPGIEYLEDPPAEYLALTEARATGELGMEGFRMLSKEEFPDERVKWGCEYWTWCVNAPMYCMFLQRRFAYRGGRLVKRDLRTPEEVWALPEVAGEMGVDAVVNASGIGFGDKAVFPTRGQTCVVANPCGATVTRQNADGSWTFCVPRAYEGGTIIGGTKEAEDWTPVPKPGTREKLLSKFAATYPPILGDAGKLTVLADVVGRRPTRKGGIRLEPEVLPGGKLVMHAYGLGGRGYELSWGVAEEVVKGVKGHLESKAKL